MAARPNTLQQTALARALDNRAVLGALFMLPAAALLLLFLLPLLVPPITLLRSVMPKKNIFRSGRLIVSSSVSTDPRLSACGMM